MEGRLPMFDMKELESLDTAYFTVLYKDPFDITIRSKNTGHFWSLHSPECPESVVVIFHSHHAEPYPYARSSSYIAAGREGYQET